ncbi:TetR/AcrR family transcriptional regulator [Yeguia hominis]|uniref:TetR/AcrR family transcriptional regulator n=1 Tax=Yeguia hominis TaxID=2763662 RepID=A0A926D7G5_9FIRM|nr:TetR/AcrR family transcriptional regulator [Yeguia hominis]MBC8532764.1 TetR/AcrR family transcriptional regulator [Yeguia hominis]
MDRFFDEIDMRIIMVSKELFLQQGIAQTEMKVIAERSGISRRTLYRRFSSKDSIALYVTSEVIRELNALPPRDSFDKEKNGFEKYAACMRITCQNYISNMEKIRLLDEFDQRFVGPYPQDGAAEDFVKYNQKGETSRYIKMDFFTEGIADGSIRPFENVDFMCRCIDHELIAICERILPREHHFIREHGYSEEFIWQTFDMILNYIQAK